MIKEKLFSSSVKKLGLLTIDDHNLESINSGAYKSYIKILFVPEGYRITVDFNVYSTDQPSLFFIAPNQFLQISCNTGAPGQFIFYNQDFYCIQIHDSEVACDGLLYNNIHNIPRVGLSSGEQHFILHLFQQMDEEFELGDYSLEEMIRSYLKLLLLKATRIWKKQHLDKIIAEQNSDIEFFRKFSILVEAQYKQKHSVADYAELLFVAPKTITHKFKRLNLPQPNEIIKNRIVLEAKRLLIHTSMTAKEIAYDLGFEDPAYFSRLFVIKTGVTPSAFRIRFHS